MNFRRTIMSLGPKWLVREVTKLASGRTKEHDNRALYAIATLLDLVMARVELGVRYSIPGQGPADARAQIGRDKRVIRGPSESDTAYDARLTSAFGDQKRKGLSEALLDQVANFFAPYKIIVRLVDNQVAGNWVTRDVDGTFDYSHYQAGNWTWDETPRWWRYWIIIYPGETGVFTDAGNWGDDDGDVWGDDQKTIGTTLTADEVEALNQIVLTWRPGGILPQAIILALDDNSFNPAGPAGAPLPDGTWMFYGANDGDNVIREARLPTARYIEVRGEF